jgi:hypothetical protein
VCFPCRIDDLNGGGSAREMEAVVETETTVTMRTVENGESSRNGKESGR